MNRYAILLTIFLSLTWAADRVEGSGACGGCAMELAASRNRMLIVYGDGASLEACSLHCAASVLRARGERRVRSVMVADYASMELIDAGTATWVVGGRLNGGMNSPARWAFAGEGDALRFVKSNGGEVTTFSRVMEGASAGATAKGGEAEVRQGHAGHDMGHMDHGSRMLANPAFGDDIYHTHPAGMWMTNYKFMRTSMSGLRDGTASVPVSKVIPVTGTPYRYMMAPTEMTMDMHMVMAMYGVTDRFTLMGMATYQSMTMDMLMNMGMGNVSEPAMRTSGFGDTELRGIFAINKYLTVSLGLSIPTGDIRQEFSTMGKTFRAPYDMQLGSGTFDLRPSLTYSALSGDQAWNWGGQATYIHHIDRNDAGYSLGDGVKATGWLQRALGPATAWLRLAYNYADHIKGKDPEIEKLYVGAPTPDANPFNYGGHRLDGLVGVSWGKGPFSFGVEGGIPLYQNLNGLQLATDWILTAGFQTMF